MARARVRVEPVKRRNALGKLVVVGYRLRATDGRGKRFAPEGTGIFEKRSDAVDVAEQTEKRMINILAGRSEPNAQTAAAFARFIAESAAGIANKKGKKCGPKTLDGYRYNCREFLERAPLIREITEVKVRDWLIDIVEMDLAEWTLVNKQKDVRTFLNWLFRRKLIGFDPRETYTVSPPIAKPRYYTDQELDALEKAAVGGPMHLALRLGYKAGMRRSEVLRMDRSDLRWFADGSVELLIWADESKNDRYRTVPLAPAIVELLGTRGQGLIYGWDRGKWEYNWAKLKAKAGIEEPPTWWVKNYKWGEEVRGSQEKEQARFHDLRHTFCRIFLESGAGDLNVLSKITGHESLDVLRKIYGHFQSHILHQAIAKAEGRIRFIASEPKLLDEKSVGNLWASSPEKQDKSLDQDGQGRTDEGPNEKTGTGDK